MKGAMVAAFFLFCGMCLGTENSAVELRADGHAKIADGVCKNPSLLFQSHTITGKGTIAVTANGRVINSEVTQTESVNVDTLDSIADITVNSMGQTVKLTRIVNFMKGLFSLRTETPDGKSHCETVKIPEVTGKIPAGAVKAQLMQLYSMIQCTGNANDFDQFHYKFPPSSIPPAVAKLIPLNLDWLLETDAQGLFHKETIKSMFVDPTTGEASKVDSDFTFSDAKAVGPAGPPVVPAEWGACKMITLPTMDDLENFWQAKTKPIAGFLRQVTNALKLMDINEFGAGGPSPTLKDIASNFTRIASYWTGR